MSARFSPCQCWWRWWTSATFWGQFVCICQLIFFCHSSSLTMHLIPRRIPNPSKWSERLIKSELLPVNWNKSMNSLLSFINCGHFNLYYDDHYSKWLHALGHRSTLCPIARNSAICFLLGCTQLNSAKWKTIEWFDGLLFVRSLGVGKYTLLKMKTTNFEYPFEEIYDSI